MIIDASTELIGGIGSILVGIAEMLGLLGAGIGFIIRSRRTARRDRLRTETAASLAAQEAKKQLEARLEQQHSSALDQYKQQIVDLNNTHTQQLEDIEHLYGLQIEQLNRQIVVLTKDREVLLHRLLGQADKKEGKP